MPSQPRTLPVVLPGVDMVYANYKNALALLGRGFSVGDEILARADYTVAMPWGLKRFHQSR